MAKKYVKVPVVMQMEALECGAASLGMILAYYGKWVTLEKLRTDCGVSRDGSNAKNILRAARSYGMEAHAFRVETSELRNNKEFDGFPCIIHWDFNHFVVLDGFRGNKARLNDPARGFVEVTMEEFDKSFTGICLVFEPSENFEKGGKPRSMVDFAASRLKNMRAPFCFVGVTALIMTLIGILQPAFARFFADYLIDGRGKEYLMPFVIAMAAALLLETAVSVINELNMLKIRGSLAITANTGFMWHVLRLPMEFFGQRLAGDLAERQKSNEGIAETLIVSLAPSLLNLVLLVFYLIVMLRYSILLSLVGLGAAVLNIVIMRIVSAKRINITRRQMRDSGKLAGASVSGIEMIETIKASGSEDAFFERWSGLQAAVNASNVRYEKLNNYLGSLPIFLQTVANVFVLVCGAGIIMNGNMSVGILLAFQGFLQSFLTPVNSLFCSAQTVQEMRTEMERVEDVMSYQVDPSLENHIKQTGDENEFSKLGGNVEMRNVTFGYSPLGNPIIKDFSMNVKAGQKVAFVGASGCGKSTLSKLISGLYTPWSGEILFDGKPSSEYARETVTGSLAVVDQDIILFEDTISENIKLWDSTIEDFEMIMAARDAQIHDDIMQRDGGYSYKILEGGKDFSGGQKQRIEIARVLAQEPTIIILDEATSALDAKTEADVVNAICARGITCIIIAHRLSTIRDCDEIIVLNKGETAERGTHDELMKKGGLYAELVTTE